MEENRIRISSNSVAISLNKGLYSREKIKQAVQDFGEACEASFRKDEVRLAPRARGVSPETLADEFCNYVLGLMNEGQ